MGYKLGNTAKVALGLGLTGAALFGAERLNDTQAWASVPGFDVPGDGVIGFNGVGGGKKTLAEKADLAVAELTEAQQNANEQLGAIAVDCVAESLGQVKTLQIVDGKANLVPVEVQATEGALWHDICVEGPEAVFGNDADDITFSGDVGRGAALIAGGATYDVDAYSPQAFENLISES